MVKELREVINIAKQAGERVLKIYQEEFKVYKKKDSSPVTEADLVSEKIILKGLRHYNYGILSEETLDSFSRLKNEKLWIIDPLDGTNDFLQKTGEFAIMIGLIYKKEPVLGVVYQPTEEKMYFAQRGKGAYLKQSNQSPKRLRVSPVSKLPSAHFVLSRTHFSDAEEKIVKRIKVKKITHVGSVGIKLGLIAEGIADAYFTTSKKTSQWDICAPEIILKEAGGRVTDLNGKDFIYNRPETKNLNGIVASNKTIHSQLISALKF